MKNVFSYLTPTLESLKLSPKMVQLFIPPISWRGDPVGHVGTYDTFFYVVTGEISLIIDDESFIVREGELAFLPRGRMRTYSNMSPTITLYEMNFEADINDENWDSALELDGGAFLVKPENSDEIKQLFEDSVRYEFNRSMAYDVIHCTNLLRLMGIFITEQSKQKNFADFFSTVIKYMHENIERTIKTAELSQLVFMEETYFIKKFKKAFGDSPITYINKLRIYKAMTLLAKSALPLSDVCHKVGISDTSYFSKIFKSHCGITPGEYRNIFNNKIG